MSLGRVNAYSTGTFEEQQERAAEGLNQLAEYGAKQDINIIVENHGGLSSNGEWLAGVMKRPTTLALELCLILAISTWVTTNNTTATKVWRK